MTYTIKLKRRFWFALKLKKVKGHHFLSEIDPQTHIPEAVPKGIMMVIFENEERMFINVSSYGPIRFSDGWFKSEAERAKEDAQSQ